jgi:membrane-bound inhibitor of C-type lysozyme
MNTKETFEFKVMAKNFSGNKGATSIFIWWGRGSDPEAVYNLFLI